MYKIIAFLKKDLKDFHSEKRKSLSVQECLSFFSRSAIAYWRAAASSLPCAERMSPKS